MSIDIILGPMFSGKTTELQRRVRRYTIAGRKCLVIKYVKDTRYAVLECCTHDLTKVTAVAAMRLREVPDVDDYDVLGVDEGQFFPDVVDFCDEMANKGKVVIVAALDGTFKREPFGDVLRLIPKAESVIKLSAVCMVCRKDAAFTRWKHPIEGETIHIGGAESYVAMCRTCYHPMLK
jgi:thymidine kinase